MQEIKSKCSECANKPICRHDPCMDEIVNLMNKHITPYYPTVPFTLDAPHCPYFKKKDGMIYR